MYNVLSASQILVGRGDGACLQYNALTTADGVILPLQCEYFALEGMQQLLNTIRLVRDRLNPSRQPVRRGADDV